MGIFMVLFSWLDWVIGLGKEDQRERRGHPQVTISMWVPGDNFNPLHSMEDNWACYPHPSMLHPSTYVKPNKAILVSLSSFSIHNSFWLPPLPCWNLKQQAPRNLILTSTMHFFPCDILVLGCISPDSPGNKINGFQTDTWEEFVMRISSYHEWIKGCPDTFKPEVLKIYKDWIGMSLEVCELGEWLVSLLHKTFCLNTIAWVCSRIPKPRWVELWCSEERANSSFECISWLPEPSQARERLPTSC